ncbi:MAG: membrane protein insertase YidC [Clostridia bacterium]|nr:membrane protein insertase YidC [Clostridia bacterium]
MDLLMVAQPTGIWETILFAIESWVGNYAIAIILITIAIKLIMLPFDFMNKVVTKKNTRKQAEMKPELDKLKARYGNNQDLLQKKTLELYKAKNYKMGGMCGVMLANMAVSMLIFFTLLGSLNNIANYKIYTEYDNVRAAYTATYETVYNEATINGVPADVEFETVEEYATAKAQDAAAEKYGEVRTGFLWIKNIWLPDSRKSPIMSYEDFSGYVEKLDKEAIPTEEEYNMVMGSLKDNEEYSGANGFYILCILAAGSTWASTYINSLVSKWKAKKKGVLLQGQDMNKSLNIILPLIMGLFTLFYTASFGLYIVTSSLFTTIAGIFVSMIVDKIDEKVANKEKLKTTNSYDRKI